MPADPKAALQAFNVGLLFLVARQKVKSGPVVLNIIDLNVTR